MLNQLFVYTSRPDGRRARNQPIESRHSTNAREVGEIHWYAILSYRMYVNGLLVHSLLSASGVSVVCRAPWGPRIKHPAALVAKRCPRAWECGRRLRRALRGVHVSHSSWPPRSIFSPPISIYLSIYLSISPRRCVRLLPLSRRQKGGLGF